MQVLIDTIMEKHAVSMQGIGAGVRSAWGGLPWVKKWRAAVNSPTFKAKKLVGKAALVAAPVAAGAYWLDKPEPRPQASANMLGQTSQGTM